MPKELFAKNLNHLITKNNLTQADFTARLGLSHSAAGPWIRGGSIPKIKTLIEISDVFGITVEKLMRHDLTKTA